VDLPPIKSLPRRRLELMVIIMPAFAQGDEGQEEAVAAFIVGDEPFSAEDMSQGIDRASAMEKYCRADKKSPDDQLPGICAQPGGESLEGGPKRKERHNERQGAQEIEAVEEN